MKNLPLWPGEERTTMTLQLDSKEVGKRLQSFREIRGLNRAALALKLGLTEAELENMEAGKKQLTKEHIETLRETFSLDPAWLLGGQDL
jgi:transcriptional regulator with XRE-family HTH domain